MKYFLAQYDCIRFNLVRGMKSRIGREIWSEYDGTRRMTVLHACERVARLIAKQRFAKKFPKG